jgi:molybdopterin/thiamine biosynthesis adenylyltransferase
MKTSSIIRFNQKDYQALKAHLLSTGKNENQAFALCSRAKSLNCSILICNKLILPCQDDINNQTGASIEPTRKFQSIVYGLAYELGLDVVDIHTHPFCKEPRFSTTDDYYGTKNAEYITEHFSDTTTMGMVVFGKDLDCFEAKVWDRDKVCFEQIKRIEILGCPTQIISNRDETDMPKEDAYARHRIIPGWQQGRLEQLKIFLCGLGGNGALVLESLLALGIGRYGWIEACDPDILEASNLPRIPYAYSTDVGRPKSLLAQYYAHCKNPKLKVSCHREGIESKRIQEIAKEANILIGCIDNDGGRKTLNKIASCYLIPYIDLGTEIIPKESSYEAVGQVQIFVPGQTGCLLCSGAIDPSEAALDSLSEETQAEYAGAGYIRGSNETPTPSVLHLNGVTSHLAISQFLRLVFDDNLEGNEFFHYDRQKHQLLTAAIDGDPGCPVCGTRGYIGSGDKKHISTTGKTETVLISAGKVIKKPTEKGMETIKKL